MSDKLEKSIIRFNQLNKKMASKSSDADVQRKITELLKSLAEDAKAEGKILKNGKNGLELVKAAKPLVPDSSGNVVMKKPAEQLGGSMKVVSPFEQQEKIAQNRAAKRGMSRVEQYADTLKSIERIENGIARGTLDEASANKFLDDLYVRLAEIDPEAKLHNQYLDYKKLKKEGIKKAGAKFPIDEGFSYSIPEAQKEMRAKQNKLSRIEQIKPESLKDSTRASLDSISKVEKDFAEKLAKEEGEKSGQSALKKILSTISKTGKSAIREGGEQLAKRGLGLTLGGAMEGFDAERGGDEPGSLGDMIESGNYSGKDLEALKEVGTYPQSEGTLNYAGLKPLEVEASLAALNNKRNGAVEEQRNKLMEKLGQQPASLEDIVTEQPKNPEELKDNEDEFDINKILRSRGLY